MGRAQKLVDYAAKNMYRYLSKTTEMSNTSASQLTVGNLRQQIGREFQSAAAVSAVALGGRRGGNNGLLFRGIPACNSPQREERKISHGVWVSASPTVYEKLVEFTVVDGKGHRHVLTGLEGTTMADVLNQHTDLLGKNGARNT